MSHLESNPAAVKKDPHGIARPPIPRVQLNRTIARLMMRAVLGHAAFEAEKQNHPVDPAHREWPPELLEGDDLWFEA